LSISYNRVGNVLLKQGNLDEALKAYRDAAAIAERLVAAERSNTWWQRDLSLYYRKMGSVLVRQGNFDEALKSYRAALPISEQLAAVDRSNIEWQHDLGGLVYEFVLARDFATALKIADETVSLWPATTWLHTNRAHALMFLNRVDEARALYLKYRGQQKVSGDKSWEAVILEDFAELSKTGLMHPLMEEIEKAFTAKG
jgi:tetratricopeptide (TPR) repeat protein